MLAEDDDALDYFIYYEEEKYPLGNKKQDVEEDQRHLVGKNLENKSVRDILPGRTLQDELLRSELSSFLREVRYSE